jgi:4-diphosphocytidyl-2-C-methyl-D-erythritol kinase
MTTALANAKINLGLVVGPLRDDGKHELVTVYQQVALFDRISIEPAAELAIAGFDADTLVRDALQALAREARVEPQWSARIEKRIPVASGLGGGSSDAAAALRLAKATLTQPVPPAALDRIAASLGADVPLFLHDGPQLGTGDGTTLEPLDLPQDYWILLALPHGVTKSATADVYRAFDERDGAAGFDARCTALHEALARKDLARLPRNDLGSSPLADELEAAGAFRADVSGAGPTVYALFERRSAAEAARRRFAAVAEVWLTAPAWYV